jgi:hypothetical protein
VRALSRKKTQGQGLFMMRKSLPEGQLDRLRERF